MIMSAPGLEAGPERLQQAEGHTTAAAKMMSGVTTGR